MGAFRIICEEDVIEADLLDDDAPHICAYMRSVLPLDGTMVHAKFAGEETIIMVPFFAEQENPKLNVVSRRHRLLPQQADDLPLLRRDPAIRRGLLLARVRSNLEGLARCGRRLLEAGHLSVRLERAYWDAAAPLSSSRSCGSSRPSAGSASRPTSPACGASRCRPWATCRASSTALRPLLGRRAAPGALPGRPSPATCDCLS